MNKEYVLEKLAFTGVTPFSVANKKELESPKGFLKEQGNRIAGSVGGGVAGGTLGALLGLAIMSGVLKMKPHLKPNLPVAMGALLGLPGFTVGGVMGDYKSLRKTEGEAGVVPSTFGKYMLRNLGVSMGTDIAATGTLLAAPKMGLGGHLALKTVLQPLADYAISRKLIGYKEK